MVQILGQLQNLVVKGVPLYESSVSAGFPSPADDFVGCKLDLNRYLIKHPAASYFVKVHGDSMEGAGIHNGDLLLVDRAIPFVSGQIVIASFNSEFTVKRLQARNGRVVLFPENRKYKPLIVKEHSDFQLWGVVTHVIKSFAI